MRYALMTIATLILALSAGRVSASDLSGWMMGYTLTDPEAVGLYITTVNGTATVIVAATVDANGNVLTAPTFDDEGDNIGGIAVAQGGEMLGDFIADNQLSTSSSQCSTFADCIGTVLGFFSGPL